MARRITHKTSEDARRQRLEAYGMVPSLEQARCTPKMVRAARCYQAGQSVTDIARLCGVSESRVVQMLDDAERHCLCYVQRGQSPARREA